MSVPDLHTPPPPPAVSAPPAPQTVPPCSAPPDTHVPSGSTAPPSARVPRRSACQSRITSCKGLPQWLPAKAASAATFSLWLRRQTNPCCTRISHVNLHSFLKAIASSQRPPAAVLLRQLQILLGPQRALSLPSPLRFPAPASPGTAGFDSGCARAAVPGPAVRRARPDAHRLPTPPPAPAAPLPKTSPGRTPRCATPACLQKIRSNPLSPSGSGSPPACPPRCPPARYTDTTML